MGSNGLRKASRQLIRQRPVCRPGFEPGTWAWIWSIAYPGNKSCDLTAFSRNALKKQLSCQPRCGYLAADNCKWISRAIQLVWSAHRGGRGVDRARFWSKKARSRYRRTWHDRWVPEDVGQPLIRLQQLPDQANWSSATSGRVVRLVPVSPGQGGVPAKACLAGWAAKHVSMAGVSRSVSDRAPERGSARCRLTPATLPIRDRQRCFSSTANSAVTNKHK